MYPPDDTTTVDINSWSLGGLNDGIILDNLPPWDIVNVVQSDSGSHSSDDFVVLNREQSSSTNPCDTRPRHRTLAPNLTRKSHKKSRAGCFTCKGRKIKCGEEKPVCRNCVQKTLECQYPDHRQLVSRNIVRRPTIPQQSISPTAGVFTLADFRFFQHFLKFAYPTLPAGNDQVWVSNVPQLALENEYLMHAALSLGASHLHRLLPENDYQTQALMHRGHAISGLNQAIAQRYISRNEADAMLAACYALTFQASYMEDGLQDFITMVRGCALVTGRIHEDQADTVFDLSPNLHFEALEPGLSQMPSLDVDFLDSGIIALEGLKHLVVAEGEERFHSALMETLLGSRESTRQGFITFAQTYSCWYLLQGESFRSFTEPSNHIAQVLLAYFVGLQLMMAPVTAPLYTNPLREGVGGLEMLMGIIGWGEKIIATIPDELQTQLAWPKMVIATIRLEIANPKVERRVLRLKKVVNS